VPIAEQQIESAPQYHQNSITSVSTYYISMNGCLRSALVELILIRFTIRYQTCCQKVVLHSVYRSESA